VRDELRSKVLSSTLTVGHTELTENEHI